MSDTHVIERVYTGEPVKATIHSVSVQVINDDETVNSSYTLPDKLPEWAMSLADHATCVSRTATYHCLHCDGEHEEFRQDPRQLPYAKVCGCAVDSTSEDGSLATCTAPALRRVTYPGEGVPVNARRFEPLCIYERADYDSIPADTRRSLQKYYVPGRNNEPTEPGMKRIEITNIHDYNRVIKQINAHEVDKMDAHRAMHREYFGARRKAMREDVDARVGPQRYHPLVQMLRRAMRARSDAKFNQRYGKRLDSQFQSQLIERNQSNMQDFCAEDTGWKSRRAR